jgi:hypothetical protein
MEVAAVGCSLPPSLEVAYALAPSAPCTSGPGFNDVTSPVYNAELWNPATES